MRDLMLRLSPERHEITDLVFGTVALLLAITGFRAVFSGNEEVVVGIPAVLLGLLVGAVLAKLRLGLLPAMAMAALVWLVLGGSIAIRSEALFGVLPTLGVLVGLADGVVAGWIRLLTTVPPAGEAGNLLTVPYTVGYVGGVLTAVTALRQRGPWCVGIPVVVLVVAILFGTDRPASLLLQGVVFAAVTIGWLALRENRRRASVVSAWSRRRAASAACVLVVVAAAAPLVGPQLPGAEARPRFVLRDHVEPPFDPLKEPSPLAGYRLYSGVENEDTEILEVEGLPPGTPIRLAVLDDFDGLVWRASGRGGAFAGRFVRTGVQIPTMSDAGELARVEVRVLRPHGVWLPTVGDVAALRSAEPEVADRVRFNIQTDTAAVPGGVPENASYSLETYVQGVPEASELAQLPIDPRYAVNIEDDLPSEIVKVASELRGSSEAPYAKLEAIAAALRTEGAFSDGGSDATVVTPPGHSLARLARFLGAPQWVGNGEQYAAALGLLARAEGIPVRVVMGFLPEVSSGPVVVTGSDVAAWVEIPLDGVGWVPISATPPQENEPDPAVQPRPEELNPDPQPPPPVVIAQRALTALDLESTEVEAEEEEEDDEEDATGGPPLLLLVAAALLGLMVTPPAGVVVAKRRRRFRRRKRGTTPERAHGGWQEVIDVSRDLGLPVPPRSTRLEAARVVAVAEAVGLATRTDSATFGASMPTEADIERLWVDVATVLARIRSGRSRLDRLRAAINPTSLRKGDR